MTAAFRAEALEPTATGPLILALPKGRILAECAPLLHAAGIHPHPDYANEDSRALRFAIPSACRRFTSRTSALASVAGSWMR